MFVLHKGVLAFLFPSLPPFLPLAGPHTWALCMPSNCSPTGLRLQLHVHGILVCSLKILFKGSHRNFGQNLMLTSASHECLIYFLEHILLFSSILLNSFCTHHCGLVRDSMLPNFKELNIHVTVVEITYTIVTIWRFIWTQKRSNDRILVRIMWGARRTETLL